MKLLFDENLPSSLIRHLAEAFPGSTCVGDVGLAATPDEIIRQYAIDHGFVLATKDVLFYRTCVARGHPPKIVWVALGNCSVARIVEAFLMAQTQLVTLAGDNETFLVLR